MSIADRLRSRTFRAAVASALLLVSGAGLAMAREPEKPASWSLRVGQVELEPLEGRRDALGDRREPFLVQLDRLPGAGTVARLRRGGLLLERYVGSNAYLARCPRGCSAGVLDELSVRAVVAVTAEMKLSPALARFPPEAGSPSSSKRVLADVVFVPELGWDEAHRLLERLGLELRSTGFEHRRSVAVRATRGQVLQLAERPEVAWIEPSLPPPAPLNIGAASRLVVDRVLDQAEFFSADGTGARIGVLDWFPSTTHTDMEDRVTWVSVRQGENRHGQLMSGSMAGAGLLDPSARGMAPGARLFWFSMTDRHETWDNTRSLVQDYDVSIANNSWGVRIGWWVAPSGYAWSVDVWAYGYYHELAADADELARENEVLLVAASGNSREFSYLGPHQHTNQWEVGTPTVHQDMHSPNPDFGSLVGIAVAKNMLVVGSTTKDDLMSWFSCWGPTLDGRVKPDVVTPGLDVLTTDQDDGYLATSGTSVSSALASGTAALLEDVFVRRHGRRPDPLTLKSVMVHSARDLGELGPDYRFGHGLLDAELTARVIAAARFEPSDAPRRVGGRLSSGGGKSSDMAWTQPDEPTGELKSWLLAGELDQGEERRVVVVVPDGAEELRATLAWHDPPAASLVNDLDLRLEGPAGSIVWPFVLDVEHPERPALRGRNEVDNLEHVRVLQPRAGRWRVVLEGTHVAMPPQSYSLVVSAGPDHRPLQRIDVGRVQIENFFLTTDPEGSAQFSPTSVFAAGDPLNYHFELGVPENADYGTFFGSVNFTGSVVDGDGEALVIQATGTHGLPGGSSISVVGEGLEVPEGMATGQYVAHMEVTMGNGVEATAPPWPFTIVAR